MKCQKCRQKAVIKISRANAKYCKLCFDEFFVSQIKRVLSKDKMALRDDRILVAVSGGKDSLALWHVLIQLGYQTAGIHIDLGIGSYSESSSEKVCRSLQLAPGARISRACRRVAEACQR